MSVHISFPYANKLFQNTKHKASCFYICLNSMQFYVESFPPQVRNSPPTVVNVQIDRFLNTMWTSVTISNKTKCTEILRHPLLTHWPQVSFEKQLCFHLLVVFLLYLVRIMLFVACNVATNFVNFKRINFAIFLVTTVSSEYPLHMLCLCWERSHVGPLPSDRILSLQDWKFHTRPNPYCFYWFITMTDIRLELVED